MPIVPDTKDWTWVLERTCSECDFDVRSFPRDEIGTMIRDAAERWREVLARPRVGARPREDVWSPLEYGCHVRDVFDVYRERLQLMIEEDDPEFPNWDQDSTAVEQLYAEQDPEREGFSDQQMHQFAPVAQWTKRRTSVRRAARDQAFFCVPPAQRPATIVWDKSRIHRL